MRPFDIDVRSFVKTRQGGKELDKMGSLLLVVFRGVFLLQTQAPRQHLKKLAFVA